MLSHDCIKKNLEDISTTLAYLLYCKDAILSINVTTEYGEELEPTFLVFSNYIYECDRRNMVSLSQ